jgi:hypothetical protein
MDSLLNNIPEPNESLLNTVKSLADTTTSDESLIENLRTAGEELAKRQKAEQPEKRKLTPDEQAQIVFENYIRNTQRLLSGKEKRRLLRECQRNAKKGRYEYMFDEEKQAKKRERMAQAFNKMNNPSNAVY